jgi:hypothetical protein
MLMSLFDVLENEAEGLGAKAGLSPQQVQSISATLKSKLGQGTSQPQAIEEVAAKHGIPVAKIEELLGHAGGSGDLMGQLSGIAGGLFRG